uniref:Disulphide bond corrector protein DsbC n=1 Tax=Candidatus Kentrum eta TaxID=2126337 RepID=A0A450UGU5_9GAMM|nr:MAG: Disulphide bond corrector protein DsbC [Candidatus Kentron sp. H]VFJ92961.1 MAG: Disulphide bond corrector protein DsbC [Candidatus Kentron sp. H]VFJ99569.1 MAG: Disulphide bond corrector protein DsbC [Candidatus Kentron sp. H]
MIMARLLAVAFRALTISLSLALPLAAAPLAGLFGGGEEGPGGTFLPPDEAFPPPELEIRDLESCAATSLDHRQRPTDAHRRTLPCAALVVRWPIAQGYALYRDRFRFTWEGTPGVRLGAAEMPPATHKDLGDGSEPMAVFHDEAAITVPLLFHGPCAGATPHRTATGRLTVGYQGCAQAGFCYAPITKTLPVAVPCPGASKAPG